MRIETVIITCDICHETIEDYRTETVSSPESGTRIYHYCFPCFWSHAITCDVCDDSFVHYREHIQNYV